MPDGELQPQLPMASGGPLVQGTKARSFFEGLVSIWSPTLARDPRDWGRGPTARPGGLSAVAAPEAGLGPRPPAGRAARTCWRRQP
jgi:hypothetical protein